MSEGKDTKFTWGMKDREFMADFCLIAERVLDPVEHRIFRFHFLLGARWKLCCRRLAMDRGTFFHHVYRIQSKLGHAYRETQPYGLFPLDEYFGGTVRSRERRVAVLNAKEPKHKRLIPPLRKVA